MLVMKSIMNCHLCFVTDGKLATKWRLVGTSSWQLVACIQLYWRASNHKHHPLTVRAPHCHTCHEPHTSHHRTSTQLSACTLDRRRLHSSLHVRATKFIMWSSLCAEVVPRWEGGEFSRVDARWSCDTTGKSGRGWCWSVLLCDGGGGVLYYAGRYWEKWV